MPGEESSLLRHYMSLEGFLYMYNYNSSTESAEFGPEWSFITKSNYDGTFASKYYYEDIQDTLEFSDDAYVPVGQYSFYDFEGEFTTPSSRLKNISTTLKAGSFYDGWRVSLGLKPRFNLSSMLELSGNYQLNRIEFPDRNQRFTGHIGSVRALLMFSTKHSLTAFIQYNSANDVIASNIRYRYNQREGNDLYIVYNDGINTNRQDYDPVRPVYSNRTIMLKYSYTFRM